MEKPKRYPPVCPNSDSPRSLAAPFQGMQPKRRLVHILNRFRSIERRQYHTQPVDLIRFKEGLIYSQFRVTISWIPCVLSADCSKTRINQTFLNFPPFVILEQELQAFMPETVDHRDDGKTSVDICQWRRRSHGRPSLEAGCPMVSAMNPYESCGLAPSKASQHFVTALV